MLDIVIESRKASIGPDLRVNRILPFRLRRMVGPFIFMDHAGPVRAAAADSSAFDVLPHPHIGLSTVSYLFGGMVTHRDSLGVEQVIRPGEVNGHRYGAGKLLVFSRGVDPLIVAKESATLMLLGGEPLGNRYIWWNFVSSRRERIEQAKEDWKRGRIILPPNDNDTFIPLPEDKSRPSGPAPGLLS